MSIWEDKLLLLLQDKRSEDPEGFGEYLPKVEQLLCDLAKSPPKANTTYTHDGWQLSTCVEPWWEAVGKLREGKITVEEAVKGLELCANLLLDCPFTDSVSGEVVEGLFRKATGNSLDSYDSETTITLSEGGQSNTASPLSEACFSILTAGDA